MTPEQILQQALLALQSGAAPEAVDAIVRRLSGGQFESVADLRAAVGPLGLIGRPAAQDAAAAPGPRPRDPGLLGAVGQQVREQGLGPSVERFGRGLAAMGARLAPDLVSGAFDLFGAERTAEGIRQDRDTVLEAIRGEDPGITGAIGESLGTLVSLFIPYVGAARAARLAARAAGLGRRAVQAAEIGSGVPITAVLATDPEFSFFSEMPEGQRVLVESALDAVLGASLPLLVALRRGGGVAAAAFERAGLERVVRPDDTLFILPDGTQMGLRGLREMPMAMHEPFARKLGVTLDELLEAGVIRVRPGVRDASLGFQTKGPLTRAQRRTIEDMAEMAPDDRILLEDTTPRNGLTQEMIEPHERRRLRRALNEVFPGERSPVQRVRAEEVGVEARLDLDRVSPEAREDLLRLRQQGHRLVPAYLDPESGVALPTGIAHSVDDLLDQRLASRIVDEAIDGGFFDLETGRFLTRNEASVVREVPGESTMIGQAERQAGLTPRTPEEARADIERFAVEQPPQAQAGQPGTVPGPGDVGALGSRTPARRRSGVPEPPLSPRRQAGLEVAERYMKEQGIEGSLANVRRLASPDELDPEFHSRIAEVYERAEDMSHHPDVQRAYRRLAEEIEAQYEWMTRPVEQGGAGIRVEFTAEDPYGPRSSLMMQDIEENSRLKVFATPDDSFHPLLSADENNKLRAIHDYFGHYLHRNTFAGHGEESAARAHAAMFSPEARKAMLTETRAQNSWFNFGPHSDLPPAERPFAESKTFLMSDWALGDSYQPFRQLEVTDADRAIVERHRANAEFREQGGQGTTSTPDGEDLTGTDAWAAASGEERVQTAPLMPEDVASFRRDHDLPEGSAIGTWTNPRTGTREVTRSQTFRDLREATQFAVKHDQEGVLHLADPSFTDMPVPMLRNLTEEELVRFDQMSPEDRANTVTIFKAMPDPREGASIAILGATVQKWYQASSRALWDMFGNDAPRFAALLAATSPRQSVKENMKETLRVWGLWEEAGRPTSEDAIKTVLKQAGVNLQARVPNSVKALTLSDEGLLDPEILAKGGILSGDKVDPFYANLMGNTQRVVIDAHMIRGFGGSPVGVTPERLFAMSAHTRQITETLEQLTGRTVQPRETQAMLWAVYQALFERSRGQGNTARGVLEMGRELFDSFPSEFVRRDLQNTPSFAGLTQDPEIETLIRGLGIEPPPVFPLTPDPAFDPSLIREADIAALAERMDDTTRKKFLFGLAGLAAGMAGLTGDDEELAAAAGLGGLVTNVGGVPVRGPWAHIARRLAQRAGLSERALNLLEGSRIGLGPSLRFLAENPTPEPEMLNRFIARSQPDASPQFRESLTDQIRTDLGAAEGGQPSQALEELEGIARPGFIIHEGRRIPRRLGHATDPGVAFAGALVNPDASVRVPITGTFRGGEDRPPALLIHGLGAHADPGAFELAGLPFRSEDDPFNFGVRNLLRAARGAADLFPEGTRALFIRGGSTGGRRGREVDLPLRRRGLLEGARLEPPF